MTAVCGWCREKPVRQGQRYCAKKCRQAAFRLRSASTSDGFIRQAVIGNLPPGQRFAVADPPYVGLSKKYYQHEESYAGEVDHPKLIASLAAGGYAGWALCCSAKSVLWLWGLCPPGTSLHPWVKPIGVPPATYGPHNAWEPVLIWGGRKCRPGVRDWLSAQPARGGGKLPGRKPMNWCAWLFDLLGMVAGDELADLFPGTGGIGRAWLNLGSPQSNLALEPGRPVFQKAVRP